MISPSNVEEPTCSDCEVNRLELYNDYNSGFDFRLKIHQIPVHVIREITHRTHNEHNIVGASLQLMSTHFICDDTLIENHKPLIDREEILYSGQLCVI